MRKLALVRLAFGSIRRNAGRSLLTILGVVIGVGSVVVMVAIGQGARAEIAARVASLGTNLVVVTPGAIAKPGAGGGAGSMDTLTLDDIEVIEREVYGVVAVSPVVASGTNAVAGNANWRTSIQGVNDVWFDIRSWPVASGRVFDANEVRSARKVCLLGVTVATALFGADDPVGREVRLRGIPVEVIGVLSKKGPTAEGNDQDDVAVLPYTTVRQRMAGRQYIAQILLRASGAAAVPGVMTDVAAVLRESHHLGNRGDPDFTIRDQKQIAEASQGTTDVMTTLLFAVASVSLVVGGIGIMNIMLVSVTERTREIGIRRAVGARRSDVLAQFLVEAIVLSGLGGVIGAVGGAATASAVGALTGWSTPVTASSLAIAMVFSGVIGVFFGWVPARYAAALDPIDALRHG
ncbi:MAG: FtsX-like permease family protein [Myxococcales bacterium]|nr:FtsX-like permease family protein [Myxococcales bacterium]